MPDLVAELLKRGNPNLLDSRGRTCLHIAARRECVGGVRTRQVAVVDVLLNWRRARQGKPPELTEVNTVDFDGNTPLHLAAIAGGPLCVTRLLEAGAFAYAENCGGETPCDLAFVHGHVDLGIRLERHLLFGETDAILTEPPPAMPRPEDVRSKQTSFMALDTSAMVASYRNKTVRHVARSTRVDDGQAALLLQHFAWDREKLLAAYFADPLATCAAAGVEPPLEAQSSSTYIRPEDPCCSICLDDEANVGSLLGVACGHVFCVGCWKEYLLVAIGDGNVAALQCPATNCSTAVPPAFIEAHVPPDVFTRYTRYALNSFVMSNPTTRWCPHPECGQAVVSRRRRAGDLSRVTECGKGHRFCWGCSDEPHDPFDCRGWQRWRSKVTEWKRANGSSTSQDLASEAWVLDHAKACPAGCGARIMKDTGCNHVVCSTCGHEFCFECMGPWALHGQATGGYFRCNRVEAIAAAKEASTGDASLKDTSRFRWYYRQYCAHEHARRLEAGLLAALPLKTSQLGLHRSQSFIAARIDALSTAPVDAAFLELALSCLVQNRLVLRNSYAFGYFLTEGLEKQRYDYLQAGMEASTEVLSRMLAHPHLRQPAKDIVRAYRTAKSDSNLLVAFVRKELTAAAPPDGEDRLLVPAGAGVPVVMSVT